MFYCLLEDVIFVVEGVIDNLEVVINGVIEEVLFRINDWMIGDYLDGC